MPNLPISQLPAGSALTGAELFAIVQDGVTKYTTLNNILYGKAANNYGLFNQTGSSTPITGTTDELTLIDGGVGGLSVGANQFISGDAFQATMTGFISSVQNDTLTIRIKSGAVILATTGAISMRNSSDKRWRLVIDFSIHRIGGAGTAEISTAGMLDYRQDASNDVQGEIFSSINTTTFDTTVSNTLNITAEWSSNNPLNNIYSEMFNLKKVY